MFRGLANKEGVSMMPVLLHPRSRGTVRLKSKNPFDPPLVDPKYLEHKQDVDILIEGLSFCFIYSLFKKNYVCDQQYFMINSKL